MCLQQEIMISVQSCGDLLPMALETYLQPNPEDVAFIHEQIIAEMLTRSAMPTQSWITSAVLKTYQIVGSSEAKSFGQQMAQSCQYCFRKILQVTIGKMSGAMRRILRAISSAKMPQSPGDMLIHNAALKRKATNENIGNASHSKRKPLQRAGHLYSNSNMLTPKKASSTAQLYASMLYNAGSFSKVSGDDSSIASAVSSDDDILPHASSSSKVDSVPLPTTTSTSGKVAHWYDPAHKSLVRHGKTLVNGRRIATFAGGEPLVTEVPNVLLKQPQFNKKRTNSKEILQLVSWASGLHLANRRAASFLALYFFALSFLACFCMSGFTTCPYLGSSLVHDWLTFQFFWS